LRAAATNSNVPKRFPWSVSATASMPAWATCLASSSGRMVASSSE